MAVMILFETGSLAGRSWTVPGGGSLSVGRSHSCAVRPAEPDVSGKHLVVRDEGGRPSLEVLSSHRTALDGARLSSGEVRPLAEGSRVSLGESLRFRVHLTSADADETSELPGSGETMPGLPSGATVATAAFETGTAATFAAETGTLATAATAAFADGGETTLVGGLRAAGAESTDPDDGETQVLETQVVSREEIEHLRGEHLRVQKRRVGFRALFILIALGAAVGVYAWLSSGKVDVNLVSPVILRNGVIRGKGFSVGIVVPDSNGGEFSFRNDHVIVFDSMLGENKDVPFRIELTNYVDQTSLFEERETTFARWREKNMRGLWQDQGPIFVPRFLGGEAGVCPGARCLQHRYTRVNDDGENLAGTATFFRIEDHCYVLLRELPADEEGRGYAWLEEIWTTLFAHPKNADGTPNLFAFRHWEGTAEEDDALDPAAAVDDCRKTIESGSISAWGDVKRTLTLVLRAVHGRTDPDAIDIQARALDMLERLRIEQSRTWHKKCAEAQKKAALPNQIRELEEVRRRTEEIFQDEDDERHWIVRRPFWWTVRPEGF